ncbi:MULTISPECIES: GrpB family protein [Actinosynnema]|uniref:GrpB family protein n=1 Tax=Actinosynnema TaxID=40566 RepID=UPI0020A5725E|nr:GrpB family protein [Actinosynnema pretiosum]MCP2097223.1 GrpB domain, predicted nucleotidyltransferase, UPF0157 family [Actinosynnema pretiosum]
MPSAEEITRHHEPAEENPWVQGAPQPEAVVIAPYDPAWPARYAELERDVRAALGGVALDVEHVGSTSVPGLAAKDVVDVDVTVADPTDEAAYVPALEALGYVLTVREPSFHEHRCFRLAEPRANLHVFGPDCPEVIRHRMFRDWLIAHPDERDRYAEAKRAAVPGGGTVMDYNRRKESVLRGIYARMFAAAGLL